MKEKVKKIREKKKQRKLAKKVVDGVKVVIITFITIGRKITEKEELSISICY